MRSICDRALRLVECGRRRNDPEQVPHPSGVAGFHRVDRDRGREQPVRLDQWRLALVRRDGEVFERHSGLEELLAVLGRPLEVEAWTSDCRAAERLSQRRHMRTLHRPEDPRGMACATSQRTDALRLRVERSLQVLQRQGVVEDAHIARGERLRRLRGSERG